MIAAQKRITTVVILAFLCLVGFSGCFNAAQESPDDFSSASPIKSYQYIPGVTNREIEEIEALKKQYEYFTYGMTLTSEAFVNDNGEIAGFSALFCEWLSEIFDIRFQPEIFRTDELFEKLDTHEVDFSGNMMPTEERLERYYMTDSIVVRQIVLMRLEGSRELSQIQEERPLKYVFLVNTPIEELVSLVTEPGTYEPVWAKNYEEAYRALENGDADAFVGPQVADASFAEYGGLIIEEYYPILFNPIAMTAAKPELEPVISVITKALRNGAMPYLNHLYNRGNDEYRKHKFLMSLDDEERAYLQNTASVPIAVQYFNYPIVFYNDHEKRWDGITFDLLREAEKVTGLTFDVANEERTEMGELMAMLIDGRAYMFSDLIFTAEREPFFLWAEHKYMTDQFALLSKIDFPNVSINEISYVHVALIKNTAHAEMFRTWFPGTVNATLYDNADDAFLALEQNKVDMVMAAKSKLLYYSNYYEFSGYKANYLFNYFYESSFAFNKDQPVLCSIMDKAFLVIDTDRIVNQWLTKTYDYQAQVLAAQRPWLIGAIVLSFIIIILILVIFFKNRKEKEHFAILKEQAEQNSRTKSEFLSRMSHEIRTPMNVILGSTEIQLQNESHPPETEEAFNTIYNSGYLLLDIINDLLDFSKIEADKLELVSAKYNITSLINDIMQLNLLRYDSKPIEFLLQIDKNTPLEMFGDELRIKQISCNLLSNAFKYTDTGEITLSVSGEPDKSFDETSPQCVLVLSVSDTGQGMTEEQLSELYDAYSRFNLDINRAVVGTGLGMSIVKRLVDLMDGEILVESEPGKGSVFTVRLPQKRIGSAVCGEGMAERLRQSRFQNMPKSMKLRIMRKDLSCGSVLIVDDMVSNLYVAKGLLAPYGLKIETVKSGVEAVEKIKGGGVYDIVFMDHMMPKMDGMEATRIIRRMGYTRPIVAMTANAIVGQAELFLANGFDAFISKPVDVRELDLLLIDFILDRNLKTESTGQSGLPEKAADTFDPLKNGISELHECFILDAEGAIKELEDIFKKTDAFILNEDLELYVITMHGMKNALINIGQTELSDVALKLEMAGIDGNLVLIKSETPIFVKSLQLLSDRLAGQKAIPG